MFPTGYVQIPHADYRRDELSVPGGPGDICTKLSRPGNVGWHSKDRQPRRRGGPLTETLPTNAALRQADPTQLAQIASG
jgi:hypothetical protein